jgi:hypothetical protein
MTRATRLSGLFLTAALLAASTTFAQQTNSGAASDLAKAEVRELLPEPTPTPQAPAECRHCRWLELENLSIATRYVFQENGLRHTAASQAQHQVMAQGRFKFDAKGKISLNFGLGTGSYFSGAWNNSGWGNGTSGQGDVFLKQLYLSVKPAQGVEFQVGGLGFMRGESSPATSYAGVAYLVGERLVLERPKELFFDQVAVTYGYLGDFTTPNLNKRYHRLNESNYHQFIVSKGIGQRAAISVDYTFHNGAETLRQALSLKTRELRFVDSVKFENYQRVDVNPAYGFAVSGQKRLFDQLTVEAGFLQVDQHYGNVNPDNFYTGRRFFVGGEVELTKEFSLTFSTNRALWNNFNVPVRTHFDFGFKYNVLKTLKKAGIF